MKFRKFNDNKVICRDSTAYFELVELRASQTGVLSASLPRGDREHAPPQTFE